MGVKLRIAETVKEEDRPLRSLGLHVTLSLFSSTLTVE